VPTFQDDFHHWSGERVWNLAGIVDIGGLLWQHWLAMQPTPRRLTTHQKAVLIQVLIAFPDQQVGVSYYPSASDALSYAQDFLTIFNVIGWKVNDGAPSEILNGQSTGLTFAVGAQGSLPPSAEALRDALRIYGIEVATVCDPACGLSSSGFILAIGPQE
jgi:hypothetical protein